MRREAASITGYDNESRRSTEEKSFLPAGQRDPCG